VTTRTCCEAGSCLSERLLKHGLDMQGDEGTFMFLETVLKEVLELFPSQHIHIGGDEVGRASFPQTHTETVRLLGT